MVQDLIDLAEADDREQLKFDLYSSSVRTAIQNLFTTRDIMKMRALKGKGKGRLEEHIMLRITESEHRVWFSQRISKKSRVKEMIRKSSKPNP